MQLRNGEAGRGRRVGSPQKEPWAAPGTSGGVNAVEEAGGDVRASFRGVTRLERERKWVARVWNGQKQLTLGRFDTDVAAAQASPYACMHRADFGDTHMLQSAYRVISITIHDEAVLDGWRAIFEAVA